MRHHVSKSEKKEKHYKTLKNSKAGIGQRLATSQGEKVGDGHKVHSRPKPGLLEDGWARATG
jgi:hypothetical protein